MLSIVRILTDAWRATSNGDGNHGDCVSGSNGATGVGGGRWYHFSGEGGNALPLPPGIRHCGTDYTGWLTGWDARACTTHGDCKAGADYRAGAGYCRTGEVNCDASSTAHAHCSCAPSTHCNTPGHYPIAAEGVVEKTACFFSTTDSSCYRHATVGVVQCGACHTTIRAPMGAIAQWIAGSKV